MCIQFFLCFRSAQKCPKRQFFDMKIDQQRIGTTRRSNKRDTEVSIAPSVICGWLFLMLDHRSNRIAYHHICFDGYRLMYVNLDFTIKCNGFRFWKKNAYSNLGLNLVSFSLSVLFLLCNLPLERVNFARLIAILMIVGATFESFQNVWTKTLIRIVVDLLSLESEQTNKKNQQQQKTSTRPRRNNLNHTTSRAANELYAHQWNERVE